MSDEPVKGGMHPPPHPGQFFREQILDARQLSVGDAAAQLGVPPRMLLNLLTGKAGLTPELAERIEAVFGIDKEALLRIQAWWNDARQTWIASP